MAQYYYFMKYHLNHEQLYNSVMINTIVIQTALWLYKLHRFRGAAGIFLK